MEVKIFDEKKDLFLFAYDLLKKISTSEIEKKGYCTIALSGGNTPLKFFQLLSTKKDILWDKIFIFFVDERCVDFTDERNNGNLAYKNLIKPLNIKKSNVFYIPTNKDPDECAMDYANKLIDFFNNEVKLDLVFLGIGEDGHTASLFPNSKALKEEKLVIATQKPQDEIKRITLSLKVLNNAKNTVFMSFGANKANVIKRIIKDQDSTLPSSLVQPDGAIFYLLDNDASSLITFPNRSY